METGLTFLGLLILQNALKPQSAHVIRELHNAAIRTVMVTGEYSYWALLRKRSFRTIMTVLIPVKK